MVAEHRDLRNGSRANGSSTERASLNDNARAIATPDDRYTEDPSMTPRSASRNEGFERSAFGYLVRAFSFFFCFFSLAVSFGLLFVFGFCCPFAMLPCSFALACAFGDSIDNPSRSFAKGSGDNYRK
jgi:hypothetical protein